MKENLLNLALKLFYVMTISIYSSILGVLIAQRSF